jgi:arylsulfatase A-like enzyme
METVDDETSTAPSISSRSSTKAGKPWFVWWSGTRMHFRTHVKKENCAASPARTSTTDGMVEHDMHIGKFLDKLDELGIADNTIVFYSTDNGPHYNTWPDAAITPFRGEKNTNWEGGWRVPAMVRWPGKIPAGEWTNEIVHHMDWLPTFARRRRRPTTSRSSSCSKGGYRVVPPGPGRDYKVHLDGYNILPLLTGETDESPRQEIFYFSDDGDLTALRYDDWKLIFMEQKAEAPSASGWSPSCRCACR